MFFHSLGVVVQFYVFHLIEKFSPWPSRPICDLVVVCALVRTCARFWLCVCALLISIIKKLTVRSGVNLALAN